MKNCPQCGAPIKDTAKFCMKCGCNLAQYEAAHAGGIFCPECGCRLGAPSEERSADDSDLADLSEIEREIDALVGEQEAEEAAYARDLKRAYILCLRGRYAEAGEIYDGIVAAHPDDINGYMGLIRAASENYTRQEGEEVEAAIRIAKRVAQKEDLSEFDADYAPYGRRRAEAERRKKEEAARRAEEEERQARAARVAQLFEISGGVLKRYKGQEARVEIPEGVTIIGERAFAGNGFLTDVTIGGTVREIEGYAFEKCPVLKNVTIGDGVEKIGGYAFRECPLLKTAAVGDGAESIGNNAFDRCASLTGLRLGKGLKSIGGYAFNFCEALTEAELPSGLKQIGGGAFAHCGLQKIDIPDGTEEIGAFAFSNADRLAEVTKGAGVKSIGEGGFSGCRALRSFSVPGGVKLIEKAVFRDCLALESVTLPSVVERIGEIAFKNCKSLKSIAVPDGVTEMGKGIFAGCDSLRSVVLPFVGAKRDLTDVRNGSFPALFRYIFLRKGPGRYPAADRDGRDNGRRYDLGSCVLPPRFAEKRYPPGQLEGDRKERV